MLLSHSESQSDAPHRPVERKSARPLAHGSAVAYFLSFHVSVLSEPARFIAQALARRDHSLLLLPTSSCPSATLQCEPCPCICAAPCARPDWFYRSTAGSLHIRRIVQYAHALLRRPVPSPHRKLRSGMHNATWHCRSSPGVLHDVMFFIVLLALHGCVPATYK